MNPLRLMFTTLAAFVLLTGTAGVPAFAMTDGRTSDDRPFVSGGVDDAEVADIRTKQPSYSLSLLTAARSGAYLAGVKVRITDGAGKAILLETEMDGPYLLVDLQPGTYQLEAVNEGGEKQKRTVTLRKGAPQRLVLYFKSYAEVSPDLKQ